MIGLDVILLAMTLIGCVYMLYTDGSTIYRQPQDRFTWLRVLTMFAMGWAALNCGVAIMASFNRQLSGNVAVTLGPFMVLIILRACHEFIRRS